MNQKLNQGLLGIAASLILLTTGCTCEVNSVAVEVNPSGWTGGQTVQAIFPNRDTLSVREISVFMLCCGRTGSDSLELFLTTITPDSLSVTETIVLYPSAAVGTTRYRQVTRPYRSNIILGKTGEYHFEFSHEYIPSLEGIKAVGINVKNLRGRSDQEI